jgi:hypothetical protein
LEEELLFPTPSCTTPPVNTTWRVPVCVFAVGTSEKLALLHDAVNPVRVPPVTINPVSAIPVIGSFDVSWMNTAPVRVTLVPIEPVSVRTGGSVSLRTVLLELMVFPATSDVDPVSVTFPSGSSVVSMVHAYPPRAQSVLPESEPRKYCTARPFSLQLPFQLVAVTFARDIAEGAIRVIAGARVSFVLYRIAVEAPFPAVSCKLALTVKRPSASPEKSTVPVNAPLVQLGDAVTVVKLSVIERETGLPFSLQDPVILYTPTFAVFA